MTVYISDADGRETRLPPLLSWELVYADCDACAAIEVKFLYDPGLRQTLHAACRIRAIHEGAAVFCGIVDEYRVTAGPIGICASLAGRSMQGILMDNACQAATYQRITLQTLMKTYAAPYCKDIVCGDGVTLSGFTVSSGASAWSVICAYMSAAGLPTPEFTAEGVLYLGVEAPRKTLTLSRGSIDRCELADVRYGMVSEYTVINRVRSRVCSACDDSFIRRGGSARRVLNVDRKTSLAAMKRIADERIARANSGRHTLTVRTPELFAALTGDELVLDEPILGIHGSYRVISGRVCADEYSQYTELCAEVTD